MTTITRTIAFKVPADRMLRFACNLRLKVHCLVNTGSLKGSRYSIVSPTHSARPAMAFHHDRTKADR